MGGLKFPRGKRMIEMQAHRAIRDSESSGRSMKNVVSFCGTNFLVVLEFFSIQ